MPHQETLRQESISTRNLPVNFNRADADLFEHEIKRIIPATLLLYMEDVTIDPGGILFHGNKVLPQSFPSPDFVNTWAGSRTKIKFFIKNCLHKSHKKIEQDVFWITDTWSQGYFHWMSDALPRLLTIQERIEDAILLLPGAYKGEKYIASSLKPFSIQNLRFIQETVHCKNLRLPTHTAPTGNYNENLIRDLRKLYTNFYQAVNSVHAGNKVYISRSKAQKRKVVNEEECLATLHEYGFKTIYFEDYPFEQQVEIALNAQYLISNHGAGLTNILFMKSDSKVLELRKNGDAHNNCYFALASALNLQYYYQLCRSANPDEDAHTANLIVGCHLLRENIERMLAK
jgi:capsular polysaccharide biosynthesis protein